MDANYFFWTQVFVFASHVMPLTLMQSAFVFGVSAALAAIGAETATSRPARAAQLRSLEIMSYLLMGV